MRYCLLCGLLMPHVPWWRRALALDPPPTHDPHGPDGDLCWTLFNKRMGIENPGPNPARFQ